MGRNPTSPDHSFKQRQVALRVWPGTSFLPTKAFSLKDFPGSATSANREVPVRRASHHFRSAHRPPCLDSSRVPPHAGESSATSPRSPGALSLSSYTCNLAQQASACHRSDWHSVLRLPVTAWAALYRPRLTVLPRLQKILVLSVLFMTRAATRGGVEQCFSSHSAAVPARRVKK